MKGVEKLLMILNIIILLIGLWILVTVLSSCGVYNITTNGEYYTKYEYNTSLSTPVVSMRYNYITVTDTLITIERNSNDQYYISEYEISEAHCFKTNHCIYQADNYITFEILGNDMAVYKKIIVKGKSNGSELIYLFTSLQKIE